MPRPKRANEADANKSKDSEAAKKSKDSEAALKKAQRERATAEAERDKLRKSLRVAENERDNMRSPVPPTVNTAAFRHGTGQVAPFTLPGTNTCSFPVVTSQDSSDQVPPRRVCGAEIPDGAAACEECEDKDKSEVNGSLAAFNKLPSIEFCAYCVTHESGPHKGDIIGLPCTARHRCVLYKSSAKESWPQPADMYRCAGCISVFCSEECLNVDGPEWKHTSLRRIVICHFCVRQCRAPIWCDEQTADKPRDVVDLTIPTPQQTVSVYR